MNRIDAIAALQNDAAHKALQESPFFGAVVHAVSSLSAALDPTAECEVHYRAGPFGIMLVVGSPPPDMSGKFEEEKNISVNPPPP